MYIRSLKLVIYKVFFFKYCNVKMFVMYTLFCDLCAMNALWIISINWK